MLKGLETPIDILIMLFSREQEVWKDIYQALKNFFISAVPEKNLIFTLANEDPKTLIEQIKNSDRIYMHGGSTHMLKNVLVKIPNLEKIWKDKIIAGSSAGALVLGDYYYENDDDTYNKGLGILPYKMFAHYDDTKKDSLKKLEKFGENIKILTLPEQKFVIINKIP